MEPLLIDYTPKPFYLVGVNQAIDNVVWSFTKDCIVYRVIETSKLDAFTIPPGQYGEPFLRSEAGEDKLKQFVHNGTNEFLTDTHYYNYTTFVYTKSIDKAFNSILTRENLYLKNPMGNIMPLYEDYSSLSTANKERDKWNSYQQITFSDFLIIPKVE